jgi:hypothetical protein
MTFPRERNFCKAMSAGSLRGYSQFKKVVTLKTGGNTDRGCEEDDFDTADPGGCSPKASSTSVEML